MKVFHLPNFDSPVLGHKQIVGLEITMNDTFLVEIVHSLGDIQADSLHKREIDAELAVV